MLLEEGRSWRCDLEFQVLVSQLVFEWVCYHKEKDGIYSAIGKCNIYHLIIRTDRGFSLFSTLPVRCPLLLLVTQRWEMCRCDLCQSLCWLAGLTPWLFKMLWSLSALGTMDESVCCVMIWWSDQSCCCWGISTLKLCLQIDHVLFIWTYRNRELQKLSWSKACFLFYVYGELCLFVRKWWQNDDGLQFTLE